MNRTRGPFWLLVIAIGTIVFLTWLAPDDMRDALIALGVGLIVVWLVSQFRPVRGNDGELRGQPARPEGPSQSAQELVQAKLAMLGKEPAASNPAPGSTAARMQELNALHDQGLITEDEYSRKREEILKAL